MIKKSNIIALIHFLIILTVWSTPFWLNWKIITIVWILNLLQIKIFGGCVLSQAQFNNKKDGFYSHYIKKIFPNSKIKDSQLNIILDYILPIILIILGYIIQSN